MCRHRADFVSLVQSLARRNEPEAIPVSMGACIVAGYNNWDRVARLRERFERGEPVAEGASDWSEAFRAVRERKEMYQDRFVLLSSGPYSGVPAAELGLSVKTSGCGSRSSSGWSTSARTTSRGASSAPCATRSWTS